MRRTCVGLLALLAAAYLAAPKAQPRQPMDKQRQHPSDLEIGGELTGLPPGSTRYITREELLAMPQLSYTVSDDANFTAETKIGGVDLTEWRKRSERRRKRT